MTKKNILISLVIFIIFLLVYSTFTIDKERNSIEKDSNSINTTIQSQKIEIEERIAMLEAQREAEKRMAMEERARRVAEERMAMEEKARREAEERIALEESQRRKYNVVPLFYATDRNRTESKKPEKLFGSKRGDSISYGEILVSIPFTHKLGKIESPSIWRLEFSSSPEKHIKILKLKENEYIKYFNNINNSLESSSGNNALIFFHGYNVNFNEAAKRAAQITFDLKFNGVSVFYSWPSVGTFSAYTNDESNIKWSERNIENFLFDMSMKTDLDNIYVIAHSMGNRGSTRAITNLLRKHPNLADKFKEIILTAPDIDAEIFKRDILPQITKWEIPVTLYASADDKALVASKKVHGYPRAGDTGENIIVANGMETIDATGVDTSFLGHSYFSETKSVLSDIFDITSKSLRADERFSLIRSKNQKYWKFRE